MPPSEIPRKSKTLEEIVLWIDIALLLALGIAWEAYPRIYLHYYPVRPWPGYPNNWDANGSSNGQVSFFYACLAAALGFGQLRFSRWFQRDISKVLLRAFLLAVFVMIAGMWTIAIANRFWTIETNRKLLLEAEPTMREGTMLFRLGFWSSLALALLNLGYGLVRRPGAPSKS
jgi:hypothetical protein